MAIQKIVATVELHHLFNEISKEFGFTDEDLAQYADNIFELLDLWEMQGFVEVYELVTERKIGRIKDSSKALGAVPWYIDLYHARISEKNDPLLILRRDEETSFSVRFLASHELMFGRLEQKNSKVIMDRVRKRIDDFIQQGNEVISTEE